MIDDRLSSAHIVDRADAGAIFTSSRMRRILMMFAREPLSLTQAASVSNIELKRLHHYVQRLVRVGLLRVDSVHPRAGRPIKLYRAIAGAFFVPDEILSKPSTDELAQELRQLLQAEQTRASVGILVRLGPGGETKVEFVPSADPRGESFEQWRILRLQRGRFEQLRAELDALFNRYQGSLDSQGQVYLLHAAGALRPLHLGTVDNLSPGSP